MTPTAAPDEPDDGPPPARRGPPPPPAEYRFAPGQSGNPAGRPKNAGQSLRECINQFAADQLTEDALRCIARGKDESIVRRAAAVRLLRMIEAPDIADFEEILSGDMTLKEARKNGVNTEAIKKVRRKTKKLEYTSGDKDGDTVELEVEVEIDLYDRGGTDFDRVSDRTDGRPTQTVNVDAKIDSSSLPTVSLSLLTPDVVAAAIELEERLRNAGGNGQLPHAE